jgi:hypothetical protein
MRDHAVEPHGRRAAQVSFLAKSPFNSAPMIPQVGETRDPDPIIGGVHRGKFSEREHRKDFAKKGAAQPGGCPILAVRIRCHGGICQPLRGIVERARRLRAQPSRTLALKRFAAARGTG